MSKHTPGPWRVVDSWNDYMVEGQNGEEIIWQDGPYDMPMINEANARLIAAAPELLEALEAFVLWHTNSTVEHNKIAEITVIAQAAIAKARGQE